MASVPSPLPSSTVTAELTEFGVATSSLPSPFRSPTARVCWKPAPIAKCSAVHEGAADARGVPTRRHAAVTASQAMVVAANPRGPGPTGSPSDGIGPEHDPSPPPLTLPFGRG